MHVSTPAATDVRDDAPATPARPSLSTTSAILVVGNLVWLGWLWATLLVVLTIALLVIAGSDWNPSTSLWAGGGIGWQRWVLFSAGIALTRVFLREFVTRGVTRRRLAESAIATLVVLAAICGAVGAAGYAIEAVVYRQQDWVHELPGGGTFAGGNLPRLAFEYALLGAIYYLGGWLVGIGYLLYHWVYATLLIPVCLAPAAIVEMVTGLDTGNYRFDALPAAFDGPSVVVTIGVAVPVVAATAVAARRITRSVPLR